MIKPTDPFHIFSFSTVFMKNFNIIVFLKSWIFPLFWPFTLNEPINSSCYFTYVISFRYHLRLKYRISAETIWGNTVCLFYYFSLKLHNLKYSCTCTKITLIRMVFQAVSIDELISRPPRQKKSQPDQNPSEVAFEFLNLCTKFHN